MNEIIYPDVWKISDDRYENALEYVSVELNQKILGCIEEGRNNLIKDYIDDSVMLYMETILPEQSKWIQVMCFSCGMTFAAAVKGGLSRERASSITTKYINHVVNIYDKRGFVELQKEMYIHFAEEVKKAKSIKSGHIVVDTAINYIDDHIDFKIRINEIAKHCVYSVSGLQHLFSKYMKMTITEYIRKKKIEKACFLLSYTDISCTKIAEKLSYSSQSYFVTQFKKEMNINPLEYRNKYNKL